MQYISLSFIYTNKQPLLFNYTANYLLDIGGSSILFIEILYYYLLADAKLKVLYKIIGN